MYKLAQKIAEYLFNNSLSLVIVIKRRGAKILFFLLIATFLTQTLALEKLLLPDQFPADLE